MLERLATTPCNQIATFTLHGDYMQVPSYKTPNPASYVHSKT